MNGWIFTSSIFGILVLINGIINLLYGNDFGLGVFLCLVSFIYFPFSNRFLQKRIGFKISWLAKIIIGFIVVWVSLAVGAINEGRVPFLHFSL